MTGLPVMLADLEAEDAVLGAMLTNPEAIDVAEEDLTVEDFWRPGNGTLYRAMVAMRAAGIDVDPVTVAAKLDSKGVLSDDGRDRLHALAELPITASSQRHYCGIVADAARRERIRRAGLELAARVAEAEDADAAADLAERLMLAAGSHTAGAHTATIGALLTGVIDEVRQRAAGEQPHSHINVGVGIIDSVGGLERSGLHLLAARPSKGKTALALQIAAHVAEHVGPVLLASLEMTAAALAERLVYMRCAVGRGTLRSGSLSQRQWDRLLEFATAAEQMDLTVDDPPRMTEASIRSRARRMHARRPLALIVVDYLQLMHLSRRERGMSREREVAEISSSLKALARELDCAVLALSQMNRESEKRGEDSRPRLSDLRESGSLEQDADTVTFLHPKAADIKAHKEAVETAVIVAKNRSGPTAEGVMAFHRVQTVFREVAQ